MAQDSAQSLFTSGGSKDKKFIKSEASGRYKFQHEVSEEKRLEIEIETEKIHNKYIHD